MVQYDVTASRLKLRDDPTYTIISVYGRDAVGTAVVLHDGETEVTFINSGNKIIQYVSMTFSNEQITNQNPKKAY